MKKYYILTLIILAVACLFSASPVVDNIIVTPESGRVVISYDLAADGQCQVMVLVSADGGANYNIYPSALSGHVGDSVLPGNDKEIIWHPASDNVEVGNQYKLKVIARDNPIIPTNPLGAEEVESFVKITGGTFNNGTADVTISDFYMSKYEVTQAEYQAVMGSNPAHNYGVGNDYPVYYVTWFDAAEYCNVRSIQEGLTPCYDTSTWSCNINANGYRLPTEMEWMYAAKGGNQEPATGYNQYAGTDVEAELTNYAWYSSNSGDISYKVGTKTPNSLGIYHMSGNVWEWCNDWYGSYSSSAQTDPVGPASGSDRVSRGGSWRSSAFNCRVAYRRSDSPTYSNYRVGFRLARSIPTVADPVISPAGGSFDEAQTITITCETEDVEIYYTLDGTDPDQTSTLYLSPFNLASSATVKARAYKEDWQESQIASADYVINSDFVLVEGGTFNNGTADVTISDFYMCKYEITHTKFIEFLNDYGVSSNGSYDGVELIDMDDSDCAIGYSNGSFYFDGSYRAQNTECPVIEVTWYGSAVYSNWLSQEEGLTPCYNTSTWSCNINANGYRLPTEMEWMYSAKGGNQQPASDYNQYSGTDIEAELTNYAWYAVNNGLIGTPQYGTKEVGTKEANQLGLYDMSGNVWEWCIDRFGSYSSSGQTDPVGPATGSNRVFRGGSWNNSVPGCLVAVRSSGSPSNSYDIIGFRLARSSE